MNFVLRIFFSGLIAFAPSPDGKELTVLLLDTGHEYSLSDSTALPHHHPLLLARAGKCEGQCGPGDGSIAKYLYPGKSKEQAADAFAVALQDGAAWKLSRSELSIGSEEAGDAALSPLLTLRKNVRKTAAGHPVEVPTSPEERKDFSWVADLSQLVDASAGGLKPGLVSGPPPRLIAARLKLRSGKVFTYRLVRVDNSVGPIHFMPLQGDGKEASYRQALAGWVAAEIEVQGSSVRVIEKHFDSETERSMTLSPQNNEIELAVLNLPELRPEPPTDSSAQDPQPGMHFELFYELVKTPLPKSSRLVPQVGMWSATRQDPQVGWDILHPKDDPKSLLLDDINLGIGRGPYDVIICPMIQYSGITP